MDVPYEADFTYERCVRLGLDGFSGPYLPVLEHASIPRTLGPQPPPPAPAPAVGVPGQRTGTRPRDLPKPKAPKARKARRN